jgi:hypothetical protein
MFGPRFGECYTPGNSSPCVHCARRRHNQNAESSVKSQTNRPRSAVTRKDPPKMLWFVRGVPSFQMRKCNAHGTRVGLVSGRTYRALQLVNGCRCQQRGQKDHVSGTPHQGYRAC